MYKIVHTAACLEQARRIAALLPEAQTLDMAQVNSDPESLGDFENLGLVYERSGKAIPQEVIDFISVTLGDYDLSGMQYMFSLCACEGKPAHAMKIVEKLCSRVGCAPSLSLALDSNTNYETIALQISSGEIVLAKGTFGTTFYMRTHGMKNK